jgi:MFS family permease
MVVVRIRGEGPAGLGVSEEINMGGAVESAAPINTNVSPVPPPLLEAGAPVLVAGDDGIAAAETSVIEVPRIARALRHPSFRLFWAGNFLSNIGTWMQNVAQGWLVLQLTNSAFWLGFVGFAATIPLLLFSMIGGVIADHVNNRKLLIGTQTAMMVSAFMMSALTYAHWINKWWIVALALLTGLAMSLNTPSYQALVPQLVPRKDLTNAIALNSAQFNMSRVVGPTLGGFAMAMLGGGATGAAGNFFLNGLSFLAVIIALTRIRYPGRDAPAEGHLWDKLKQGLTYVVRHPDMAPLVVLTAIVSLLAVPYLVFIPYFARDVLHRGEPGLGLLMACSGLGAFCGAGTIAYLTNIRRRGRVVVRAEAGFLAAIILFTFSHTFWLSGLCLMAAGYCMVIMMATINALLQHLAEESMRGRVMSIYSTAFLGLPPVGSLIAGLLTRVTTPAHAIAGMAAVALVSVSVAFARSNALKALD